MLTSSLGYFHLKRTRLSWRNDTALQRLEAHIDDWGGKRRLNEGTDVGKKNVLVIKKPDDLKVEEEQVLGADTYASLI